MLYLNPALRVGATILLATRFSRSQFFDWLRDHAPTMVIGVPTVIKMLLEHDPRPAAANDGSSLRLSARPPKPIGRGRC